MEKLMKNLILITTLLVATSSSYAFTIKFSTKTVDISGKKKVSIHRLLNEGAAFVTCKAIENENVSEEPRCVLKGSKYGIHYPGQPFSDIEFTEADDQAAAINRIQSFKYLKMCK